MPVESFNSTVVLSQCTPLCAQNRKEAPSIKLKTGLLSWKEGRGSSGAWQKDIEKG